MGLTAGPGRDWRRTSRGCEIHYSDETLEVAYFHPELGRWEVAHRFPHDGEAFSYAGQVFCLACKVAEAGGDPGEHRYIRRGNQYAAEPLV